MNILALLVYWTLQLYDHLTTKGSYKKLVASIKKGQSGSILEWRGTRHEAKLLYKYLKKTKMPALPLPISRQLLNDLNNILQEDADLEINGIFHITITI